MRSCRRWMVPVVWATWLGPAVAFGQIDPYKRELIQFGYNAAFEGHAPLSAYAFYYWNQPDFLKQTNLTLRLAVAPTYVDSELGIHRVLGENTDLGIGLAGGGFADSYNEIDMGTFIPAQSFDGHGGEISLSLYHLFNPGQLIPLNGMLRGVAHFSTYNGTRTTDPAFEEPANMGTFKVRTGLRWGGREPTLFPALAMEISLWYQGEFRTQSDVYGYNDRQVNWNSHFFWGEAFLGYTLSNLQHSFHFNLTAGTSIDPDRLNGYRLGGFLPMVAEFPLSIPGYYYQEISAKGFVLIGGDYIIPLDHRHRWNINVNAATAAVNYLPDLGLPNRWQSGVGAGVFYTSASWRVMVGYGYGINAIRSDGKGANSVGFLLQLDLTPAKEAFFKTEPPGYWRGLQQIISVLGS